MDGAKSELHRSASSHWCDVRQFESCAWDRGGIMSSCLEEKLAKERGADHLEFPPCEWLEESSASAAYGSSQSKMCVEENCPVLPGSVISEEWDGGALAHTHALYVLGVGGCVPLAGACVLPSHVFPHIRT